MSLENLLIERDGAVTVITLNRPKVLNALNAQTLDELTTAFDAVATKWPSPAFIMSGRNS